MGVISNLFLTEQTKYNMQSMRDNCEHSVSVKSPLNLLRQSL